MARKRRSRLTDFPSREETLALMQEYTASDSLRKHMLSVEAAMRAYAAKFGEDVERWGITGLIHDFDYERFPNAAHSATEEHPAEGVRILRSKGFPEDILEAILGHAQYCGVPRVTQMSRTPKPARSRTSTAALTRIITTTSRCDVQWRRINR